MDSLIKKRDGSRYRRANGYTDTVKKVLRIKLLKEKDTSREKSKRNHWYHALYDMVSCICTDEFIVPESGTERRK